MSRSLPVIIVNGKNITAQFEAQATPVLSTFGPGGLPLPQIIPAKKDFNMPIEELDFYKLAFISAVILLSV